MRLLSLFAVFVLATLVVPQPAWAEIYKTVDENGNVIYTDQKPAPNAKPIDLPELNVAEPHRALPKPPDPIDVETGRPEGFQIVSPQPEENVWGTGGSVNVEMSLDGELKPGMTVTVFLDGQAHDAGHALSITLEEVERGEHRLKAELRGRGGRVLARSQEVLFHMKQMANVPTPPRARRPGSNNGGGSNGGGNNRSGSNRPGNNQAGGQSGGGNRSGGGS